MEWNARVYDLRHDLKVHTCRFVSVSRWKVNHIFKHLATKLKALTLEVVLIEMKIYNMDAFRRVLQHPLSMKLVFPEST